MSLASAGSCTHSSAFHMRMQACSAHTHTYLKIKELFKILLSKRVIILWKIKTNLKKNLKMEKQNTSRILWLNTSSKIMNLTLLNPRKKSLQFPLLFCFVLRQDLM